MTPSIDSARSRLFSAIDSRTDELIATVAELVREPSVLGNEAGVQQVVARHLTDAGMRVESTISRTTRRSSRTAATAAYPSPAARMCMATALARAAAGR